jgi:C1A family cysteine protease
MRIKRMGWRADLPDFRDYPLTHPKLPAGFVRGIMAPLATVGADAVEVDLRPRCSPIYDQGDLGSCTAHGVVGLHEYLELQTFGRFTPLSRRFLYKVTRNFINVHGDTGAEIRNAMGALAYFGTCPEEYDPYVPAYFDREPTAFQYAMAGNYKGTQYARIDSHGLSATDVLDQLKGMLLKGWPWVFGFTCYDSLDYVGASGAIPFPKASERQTGGHCIDGVGFSDTYDKCPNAAPGAFMIRNSWGTSWGEVGYGWLPYDYVLRGVAEDFWTLTKADWIDPEPFK